MHIFNGRRLTYANVTATLALVFSMSGGALAANHYLINSTKQISPKVLKKLKGAKGKTGAAGAAGTAGTAGATGKEGPQGKEGKPGPGAQWALISTDHKSILAQSGGISITAQAGAGVYLDMGADVNGKAVQATAAYVDGTDEGFRGSLIATICGGTSQYHATCTESGTDDTHHVWVFTENQANTEGASHAFYVSVF
jgi:hypothetical protein